MSEFIAVASGIAQVGRLPWRPYGCRRLTISLTDNTGQMLLFAGDQGDGWLIGMATEPTAPSTIDQEMVVTGELADELAGAPGAVVLGQLKEANLE